MCTWYFYFYFHFTKNNSVPYYLLVTTGFFNGGLLSGTEVINIFPNPAQVPTYESAFIPRLGATGGWVGNLFIVCGGENFFEFFSTCRKIGKETLEKEHWTGNMSMSRAYAASIVQAERLWILGGYGDSNATVTSEYISAQDGSHKKGPDMPIGLHSHVAIKINETTSMVIGGCYKTANSYYDYSAKSWFYSNLTEQWIDGPDLLEARSGHSAGLVTDSVTKELFIIVTGGTNAYGLSDYLDSTEVLNKEGTKWISGKILLLKIEL